MRKDYPNTTVQHSTPHKDASKKTKKQKQGSKTSIYTSFMYLCPKGRERVKTQRRPREPAVSVVKSCHAKVVNKVGILDSTIGRSKESVVENEGLTGVNAWT